MAFQEKTIQTFHAMNTVELVFSHQRQFSLRAVFPRVSFELPSPGIRGHTRVPTCNNFCRNLLSVFVAVS